MSSWSPGAVGIPCQDAIHAVPVAVALADWKLHHLRLGPSVEHSLEMGEGVLCSREILSCYFLIWIVRFSGVY